MASHPPRLHVAIESWPLAEAFVISRGAKTTAEVVVATLSDGRHAGRGECVPYRRYGETVEATCAALCALPPVPDRAAAHALLPAGAARNALDCAFWDLEARRAGVRAHTLAGVPAPNPVVTCYTLSLASPAEMAVKARAAARLPLLKLKLGGEGDAERMRAVRHARPDARLVADANEGWSPADLAGLLAVAAECGLECVEQPLPAADDGALAAIPHPVPICADESAHGPADVAALAGRYDAVNIKLDKTGGLTGALAMSDAAAAAGLSIMVGCMVATSLSMAPALLLASRARWVDLDGPLLLARDRPDGIAIRDGIVHPPQPALWG